MQKAQWITQGAGEKSPTKRKMAHIAEVAVSPDMPEGQKLFASNYNAMRARLIELGEMKEK